MGVAGNAMTYICALKEESNLERKWHLTRVRSFKAPNIQNCVFIDLHPLTTVKHPESGK